VFLDVGSNLFSIACFHFVEFHKIFLMVKYFLKEFFATRAASGVLTTLHLLLKSVKGTCLFFRGGKDLGSSIKVSID
jgi:hypothetical protein